MTVWCTIGINALGAEFSADKSDRNQMFREKKTCEESILRCRRRETVSTFIPDVQDVPSST